MGLFSKSQPSAAKPDSVPTEPAAVPQPTTQEIIAGVVKELMPMIQEQAQSQQAVTQPVVEEEQDADPEGTQRMTRVASQVTQTMTAPYANIYNMVMPEFARDIAVRQLSEGDRIIYDRYKKEVDEGLDRACQGQPALKSVPDVHVQAIRLMLGNHTSEIAQLEIQHLRAEELPVHLKPPSTGSAGNSAGVVEATDEEKEWVGFFAPRSRAKDWSVETMREFKNIKPGFLHEMVAAYKESKKESQ